jgi:hypothetical protein
MGPPAEVILLRLAGCVEVGAPLVPVEVARVGADLRPQLFSEPRFRSLL